MSDCGCNTTAPNDTERRILRIALGLNATMFIVGTVAGLIAQSMGLIADSLDMLADAIAYGIGLAAVSRPAQFKALAAKISGIVLFILGIGVLLGVAWHLVVGNHPEGYWMIGVAFFALLVNSTVLMLLNRFRHGEVHLRATWLFTRVDVIANLAVIVSGALVVVLRSPVPDWVIGAIIAVYILKEATEILQEAREARTAATSKPTR